VQEQGVWFFIRETMSPSPASATTGNNDDNRERNTDFEINVNYVLGFLWAGDGGTEAGQVLGTMGLPNDTTMETRSLLPCN
jgi:hypothetical protein